MSLVQAIDDLVAFVEVWRGQPPDQQRSGRAQFDVLDLAVSVEAHKLHLDDKLPPEDWSSFDTLISHPAFVGAVNLPGSGPDAAFSPIPTERWRHAMLTLRALAEAAESKADERIEGTGADPADQGETGQREGDAGSGNEQLRPSREKAYRLFQWAMEQKPDLKTDHDVYDWLNEHTDVSEELPNFATWSKYLREARAYHKDHKHTPRKMKRATGKNVVRRDQI